MPRKLKLDSILELFALVFEDEGVVIAGFMVFEDEGVVIAGFMVEGCYSTKGKR